MNTLQNPTPARSFKVIITETLKRTVEVEAESQQDAKQIVSDEWRASKYVLDAENFHGVEFEAVPTDKQVC